MCKFLASEKGSIIGIVKEPKQNPKVQTIALSNCSTPKRCEVLA